jgi:RNA recognition motif-containing protein
MKTPPEEWVYIGNLPFSATDEDMRKRLEPFGTVVEIDMPMDEDTNHFMGFAYVHLATPDEAQVVADALDGEQVGERTVHAFRYDEVLRQARRHE